MEITKEQIDFLDSFTCERLTKSRENIEAIKAFTNEKGELIVNYLLQYGENEDAQGLTTYYVVKGPDQEIMMFFSLKCGALFQPLDEEEMLRDIKRKQILLQAVDNALENNEAEIALRKALNLNHDVPIAALRRYLTSGKNSKQEKLDWLHKDVKKEENTNITRVTSTHAGIELVHFCTNDCVKDLWNSYKTEYGINHPLGEVMYWKFIVPLFVKVQSLVGCEYAFLFAADLSPDANLVNYYDVSLKFKKRVDVGTTKPFYDFCCDFMCQEINNLKDFHNTYFENFNPDTDIPVV